MVDTVGGMVLLLPFLLYLGSGEGLLSLGSLDLKELRDVQYSIQVCGGKCFNVSSIQFLKSCLKNPHVCVQILDTPVSEESQPTDDTTTAMVMVIRERIVL